jgi:type II secretory pathway component GspD/PulD (secretin)
LQSIESGTKLNITPYIGDNNDITLEMAVEVSDSIPRGRGSDLPVVTRRTASNTVRIMDGGTVAVAGLTENRTSLSKRRVPGLGGLPLLGPLFNNTYNQKSTREIAVFVTARIVPEHSQTVELGGTSAIQQTPEPVGEEFEASLRESLSRSIR